MIPRRLIGPPAFTGGAHPDSRPSPAGSGQSRRISRPIFRTEVFALKGVSERNRTRSMAITADLSLRRQDWKLAKVASERVVNSAGADEADKDFCKDVFKTLRHDHPGLFQ